MSLIYDKNMSEQISAHFNTTWPPVSRTDTSTQILNNPQITHHISQLPRAGVVFGVVCLITSPLTNTDLLKGPLGDQVNGTHTFYQLRRKNNVTVYHCVDCRVCRVVLKGTAFVQCQVPITGSNHRSQPWGTGTKWNKAKLTHQMALLGLTDWRLD